MIDFFEGTDVVFDLIFLGVGEDGHTASLFPRSKALSVSDRWVVENYVDNLNIWRVTLTAKTINASREVVFLVSGKSKADVLRKLFETQEVKFPAQMIKPDSRKLQWLVDEEAASRLG